MRTLMKRTENTPFADQSGEHRQFVRNVVCELGGDIACYSTIGFQIAAPQYAETLAIRTILAALGWHVTRECLFPLGSDKPPQAQRHTSYGQPESAWHYLSFT